VGLDGRGFKQEATSRRILIDSTIKTCSNEDLELMVRIDELLMTDI